MAEPEGSLRRRVVTLYSDQDKDQDEDKDKDKQEDSQDEHPPRNEDVHQEKRTAQIRDVAEAMFSSMCKGFDKKVISEENIDVAIENLAAAFINPTYSLVQTHAYALSSENIKSSIRKLLLEAMQLSSGDGVTCEVFCDVAQRHSEGRISLFDILDKKGVPGTKDKNGSKKLEQANLEGLLYHPVQTIKILRRDVLRQVERRGVKLLWSNLSTKHFYWLVVVYFLPMMTAQVIVSCISTALFNGAVIFMLLVTIQIGINSEKFHSTRDFLYLFQYFNKSTAQIQMRMPKTDVLHYATFTIGLLVAMVTQGFSSHSFVYYEMLAIISGAVSVFILLQFDLYESHLLWYCISAKGLSWLVVVIQQVYLLFKSSPPWFLMVLERPVFTLPFYEELRFEINPITVIQVVVHLGILATQFRDFDWETFFSRLGPLFLFLSWFVLCRNFVSSSSPMHLAVISSAAILFPFYTVSFLVSPLFFLYWFGLTAPFYYSVASIVIMGIFSALVALSLHYKKSWWMGLSLDYVWLILFGVCLTSALFVSGWYASAFQLPHPLPPVTVQEYGEYCSPKNWESGNRIQTQINCMHLQGRVLSSQAEVERVGISQVANSMGDSIRFLPLFLREAMTCLLGESRPMCGDRAEMSTCVYNGCHFQHTLTFTFEIDMKMPVDNDASVKTTLLVSDSYKDFVLKLRAGTPLQFNASFQQGMGSDHLTLRALSLRGPGLEDTRDLEKEREEEMKKSLWSISIQSVMNSIRVILEIFLGFTAVSIQCV